MAFPTFLLKELECSTDKMNKCLCWLNRLLYLAVDREIIRANPIEDVEYEKKSPPKLKHISCNELKRLMATPFEDGNMELARRMFIFSSFCGLAYVDIHRLYPHHIGEVASGRKYIRSLSNISGFCRRNVFFFDDDLRNAGVLVDRIMATAFICDSVLLIIWGTLLSVVTFT